jgi:hypothetical protein
VHTKIVFFNDINTIDSNNLITQLKAAFKEYPQVHSWKSDFNILVDFYNILIEKGIADEDAKLVTAMITDDVSENDIYKSLNYLSKIIKDINMQIQVGNKTGNRSIEFLKSLIMENIDEQSAEQQFLKVQLLFKSFYNIGSDKRKSLKDENSYISAALKNFYKTKGVGDCKTVSLIMVNILKKFGFSAETRSMLLFENGKLVNEHVKPLIKFSGDKEFIIEVVNGEFTLGYLYGQRENEKFLHDAEYHDEYLVKYNYDISQVLVRFIYDRYMEVENGVVKGPPPPQILERLYSLTNDFHLVVMHLYKYHALVTKDLNELSKYTMKLFNLHYDYIFEEVKKIRVRNDSNEYKQSLIKQLYDDFMNINNPLNLINMIQYLINECYLTDQDGMIMKKINFIRGLI